MLDAEKVMKDKLWAVVWCVSPLPFYFKAQLTYVPAGRIPPPYQLESGERPGHFSKGDGICSPCPFNYLAWAFALGWRRCLSTIFSALVVVRIRSRILFDARAARTS